MVCGPGLIAWCDFTWEAFATIFTGVGAVIAAYKIGKRQTAIQDRQTTIMAQQAKTMEKQAEIERLTLASDLYEKRIEIYDATAALIGESFNPDAPMTDGLEKRFMKALSASRFLLNEEAQQFMRRVLTLSIRVRGTTDRLERTKPEFHAGIEGQQYTMFEDLAELQKNMPTVFRELRLTGDPMDENL